MIIVLRPGASPAEAGEVVRAVEEAGYTAHRSDGQAQTIIGVVGALPPGLDVAVIGRSALHAPAAGAVSLPRPDHGLHECDPDRHECGDGAQPQAGLLVGQDDRVRPCGDVQGH